MVDKEQFESMKDEYYLLRGWDNSSGLQTETKLKKLGLDDVAHKLNQANLLHPAKK
jgi:aldehyde:ferredoxin oxidoreductase